MRAMMLCGSAVERSAEDRHAKGQRGAAQPQHEGDVEIAEVLDATGGDAIQAVSWRQGRRLDGRARASGACLRC